MPIGVPPTTHLTQLGISKALAGFGVKVGIRNKDSNKTIIVFERKLFFVLFCILFMFILLRSRELYLVRS